MHIHHLAIRVKNLEKSIWFYETLTQLTVAKRFQEAPAEVAYMTNGEGETQIELIAIPENQTFRGLGFFVCFETDTLDESHAIAKREGMNPSDIRSPDPQNRYFYVYDPDGVSVQLKQRM